MLAAPYPHHYYERMRLRVFFSLATLFGVIAGPRAQVFQDRTSATLSAAGVIVANIVLAWKYIHDRTGLKAEGMKK